MAPVSTKYGDLARDSDAFAALYEQHAPRIYRHILYMVGRAQEADELTNETFLLAWKAIDRYEDRGVPIENWLLRIGHNLATKNLRRRKPTVCVDYMDIESNPDRGPEQVLQAAAEAQTVRNAILQLPDVQRQVIVWRFLESMSYDEVEALLGKSKGAIRLIQFRALKRLRELLEEEPERAAPARKQAIAVDLALTGAGRERLALGNAR